MSLNRTLSVEIRADVAPFEAGLRRAADVLAQLDAKIAQAAGSGAKFGVIATELGDVAAVGERAGSSLVAMGEATGALAPLQGEVTGLGAELKMVPAEAERATGALVTGAERGGVAFGALGREVRFATTEGLAGTEQLAAAQGQVGKAAMLSAEELVMAYGRARLAQSELTVGTERVLISQGQVGRAAITTAVEVERAAIAIAAAEGRVSAAFAREALVAKTTQAEVAAAILRTVDAEHLRDVNARASAALNADLNAQRAVGAQGGAAEDTGALGAAASSEGGLLKGFRSTVATIALFEVGIRAGEKFREMASSAFKGAQTIGVAINQADTYFGQFATHVIHNTEQLGAKFGFSNAQMLQAADNVGRVGRQFGLTAEQTAGLAIDLEPTIGAFARFKDLSIDEVSTNFSRSLAGNTRSAKLLGVSLDETHMQQAALALGIKGGTKSWTDQETVMIRARTLQDQLGSVTARLAESQDTLAGRLATIGGRIENVLEGLGQRATPAIKGLLDGLGSVGTQLGPFFADLGAIGGDLATILKTAADAVAPLAAGLAKIGGGAVIATLTVLADALRRLFDWISDNRVASEVFAGVIGLSMLPQIARLATALGNLGKGLILEPVIHSLQAMSRALATLLAESSIGPLRKIGEALTNFGGAGTTAAKELDLGMKAAKASVGQNAQAIALALRGELPAAAASGGRLAAAELKGTLGATMAELEAQAAGLSGTMAALPAGGLAATGAGAAGAAAKPATRAEATAAFLDLGASTREARALAAAETAATEGAFALRSALASVGAGLLGGAIAWSQREKINDFVEQIRIGKPRIEELTRAVEDLGQARLDGANLQPYIDKINELARFDHQGFAAKIKMAADLQSKFSVGTHFSGPELPSVSIGSFQIMGREADDTATRVQRVTDSFHDYDKALSSAVRGGNVSQAKAAFDQVSESLREQGFTVAQIKTIFPEYGKALDVNVRDKAKAAREAAQQLAKDLHVPEDAVAGWEKLADEIGVPVAALIKVGEEAGFTQEQIASLAAGGISDFEALGASVKSMQDTFAKGVNPLSLVSKFATPLDFTGLEAQKKAAEEAGKAATSGGTKSESANLSAKRAVDAHTTALNKLAEAQARLDDLRSNPKSSPTTIAAAEHRVAEAQQRVASSADAAAIAQTKAGDASSAAAQKGDEWTLTAERIRQGYTNVLTNVTQFNADMATLVTKGLNPQTLVELMQMEPQAAAGIAKAILSDTGKTTIDTINLVSTAMTKLIVQHTRFSQLSAVAVAHADKPDAARFAEELPTAQQVFALQQTTPGITAEQIEKMLGISPAQLQRVSDDYQINVVGLLEQGKEAARRLDPAAALKPDLHDAAFRQLGGSSLPAAAGQVIEETAQKMIEKNSVEGRRAWEDFATQFGPETAIPIMERIAATLRAEGHIQAALKIEGLIDEAQMRQESERAANTVAEEFGFKLGSKGEGIVTALADSVRDHSPAAMTRARDDLIAAFDQDKANAILLSMAAKMRIAGNLVGAIQLEMIIDPRLRLMNYVLQDAQTDARFGPGGAHSGAPRALGGFDRSGDVRDGHLPEIARGGAHRYWAEDETQGETYIPHAPDHRRPAAERYLARTAELFGGVYIPKTELVARLDRDTVHLAEGAVLARLEPTRGSEGRGVAGSTRERPTLILPFGPPSSSVLRERSTSREREVLRHFAAGGVVDRRSRFSGDAGNLVPRLVVEASRPVIARDVDVVEPRVERDQDTPRHFIGPRRPAVLAEGGLAHRLLTFAFGGVVAAPGQRDRHELVRSDVPAPSNADTSRVAFHTLRSESGVREVLLSPEHRAVWGLEDVHRRGLVATSPAVGPHAPTLRPIAGSSSRLLPRSAEGTASAEGFGEGPVLRTFALGGFQFSESRHEGVHHAVVAGRPVVDREVARPGRFGDHRSVSHRDERALVREAHSVRDAHGTSRFGSRPSAHVREPHLHDVHAPTLRAFALGGVERGDSFLAGQGRASAGLPISPREGTPRIAVLREGAPQDAVVTTPPGRGATVAVPVLAAFAAGGITMRPTVVGDPGIDRQGYLLARRAAIAQPGAVAAIARPGIAMLGRWLEGAAIAKRAADAAAAAAASAGGMGRGGSLAPEVQLMINAALGITGTDPGWYPTLAHLVMRESGGNPRAVNPITVLGQHATGLFQMLPSTFRSHALPGYGDIFNPIDNAISAIRYIAARYGSPLRIPHLYDNSYQGYALGGVVRGEGVRRHLVERRQELTDQLGLGPVVDRDLARPMPLGDKAPVLHRRDLFRRDRDTVRDAGHRIHAPTVAARFASDGVVRGDGARRAEHRQAVAPLLHAAASPEAKRVDLRLPPHFDRPVLGAPVPRPAQLALARRDDIGAVDHHGRGKVVVIPEPFVRPRQVAQVPAHRRQVERGAPVVGDEQQLGVAGGGVARHGAQPTRLAFAEGGLVDVGTFGGRVPRESERVPALAVRRPRFDMASARRARHEAVRPSDDLIVAEHGVVIGSRAAMLQVARAQRISDSQPDVVDRRFRQFERAGMTHDSAFPGHVDRRGWSHGDSIGLPRGEVVVARRAQPDVRLALGGVTPPAAVGVDVVPAFAVRSPQRHVEAVEPIPRSLAVLRGLGRPALGRAIEVMADAPHVLPVRGQAFAHSRLRYAPDVAGEVGHVGVEVGSAHAGGAVHLDRGQTAIAHQAIHRALGHVQRGGDLVGGEQQRGRGQRHVADHVVGVVARHAGDQRLPAFGERNVVTRQRPPVLLQRHAQVPLEIGVQAQRDHALIVEPRASYHTLVTTRPGFAPRMPREPRQAPVAGRVAPRLPVRTHEPEALLAPLAWIEGDFAHPERADVRRGRTPTGPPRRIGPAFMSRLAPVVAERLARHEPPAAVGKQITALHRLAHDVGLAAKGRVPEAPIVFAGGAVLGDVSAKLHRVSAQRAAQPSPLLGRRPQDHLHAEVTALESLGVGRAAHARVVRGVDSSAHARSAEDGDVHALSVGAPTTFAGGALLASGHPRELAPGALRQMLRFPMAAPSDEQFRAVVALLGPVAQRTEARAKLGGLAVAPSQPLRDPLERPARLVPADGDGRRLGLDQLQRFDRGGLVGGRRGEPQLVVAHGGERVVTVPGSERTFPAHAAAGSGAMSATFSLKIERVVSGDMTPAAAVKMIDGAIKEYAGDFTRHISAGAN